MIIFLNFIPYASSFYFLELKKYQIYKKKENDEGYQKS